MRRKPDKLKKIRESVVRVEKKRAFPVKLFGKWDTNVAVNDPSLKMYINLDARFLPRSAGKFRRPFHKSKMHIAERLALHLMVPGHTGRRHKLTSGTMGGKFYNTLQIVENALNTIEKKTKLNPVEVLVHAIENSALREEVITYQMGSIVAREAVVTAPQRRIDKTLRFFAQGAYKKSHNKRIKIEEALADEIILSHQGKDSFAIKEKERIEREAMGAR